MHLINKMRESNGKLYWFVSQNFCAFYNKFFRIRTHQRVHRIIECVGDVAFEKILHQVLLEVV